MTKIDLITGFLGSGKTTFLKIYAEYLKNKGLKIGILENDYGAVNVDMMLLKDLEGDNCELEMVAGACCRDCHFRRFKTKLIALGMEGLDRVLVEPSGIFDVDEFFDSLHEEPLCRMYEIGSVIAIVDARLEDDMSDESDFYLASQAANAGTVLLSRVQLTDPDHISSVIRHIASAADKAGLDRDVTGIIETGNWFDFTDDDLARIQDSGYRISSYVKSINGEDSSYSSVYFLEIPFTTSSIRAKISDLMNDEKKYGNIFRIKGFYEEGGKWYEVNATKRDLEICPISEGQMVVIVIGENLNKDSIEEEIRQ